MGRYRVRRRERLCALSAVICAAMLGPFGTKLAAQAVHAPTRVWMSLGLGGGGVQDLEAGGIITFQLTGQWRSHHVAFRALIMGDTNFQSGSGDSINEAGILYGRRLASSFGYVSAAAGVAAVSAEGFSGAPRQARETIGLPVVVEAAFQAPVIGLGIQAFGNLNSVALYGGVSIVLHLGWMQ